MFNLETLLRAAQQIGPAVIAAVPAVRSLFDAAAAALSTDDQAVAKEALDDIMAGNDDAHRRLQEKLEAASKR